MNCPSHWHCSKRNSSPTLDFNRAPPPRTKSCSGSAEMHVLLPYGHALVVWCEFWLANKICAEMRGMSTCRSVNGQVRVLLGRNERVKLSLWIYYISFLFPPNNTHSRQITGNVLVALLSLHHHHCCCNNITWLNINQVFIYKSSRVVRWVARRRTQRVGIECN